MKKYIIFYSCVEGHGNVDATGNIKAMKNVREIEKSIEKKHDVHDVVINGWKELK